MPALRHTIAVSAKPAPITLRDLLILAFPLILSTGSLSIQHFVDRMFLTWHSPEAIAAVTPAGMLNFALTSFFLGIASYVTTFVAQYTGAGQDDRIGPVVWQGVLVAGIGALTLAAVIPLAAPVFALVGHDPAVQRLESVYFKIVCLGAFPSLAASAMSGFFSGRGRTWVVMWVYVAATVVNVFFDYVLIFGNLGFPEWGIAGAAVATDLAFISSFVLFFVLMIRRRHRERYQTIAGCHPDWTLFKRLLRFGLPNGFQFLIDMSGFTIFVLLVGRLGTAHLAATNIAFNVNTIAFMPMIGLGMAVTILVGQNLGMNNPRQAERAVYLALRLTLIYMGATALLYLFMPGVFLAPYAHAAAGGDFEAIRDMTVILLRFVAFYALFDALNIIFASALKGAGDTRFIMLSVSALSIIGLIIPIILVITVFHGSLYTAWTIATVYVSLLGLLFWARFLTGRWKTMRVIEQFPSAAPPPLLMETPPVQGEF